MHAEPSRAGRKPRTSCSPSPPGHPPLPGAGRIEPALPGAKPPAPLPALLRRGTAALAAAPSGLPPPTSCTSILSQRPPGKHAETRWGSAGTERARLPGSTIPRHRGTRPGAPAPRTPPSPFPSFLPFPSRGCPPAAAPGKAKAKARRRPRGTAPGCAQPAPAALTDLAPEVLQHPHLVAAAVLGRHRASAAACAVRGGGGEGEKGGEGGEGKGGKGREGGSGPAARPRAAPPRWGPPPPPSGGSPAPAPGGGRSREGRGPPALTAGHGARPSPRGSGCGSRGEPGPARPCPHREPRPPGRAGEVQIKRVCLALAGNGKGFSSRFRWDFLRRDPNEKLRDPAEGWDEPRWRWWAASPRPRGRPAARSGPSPVQLGALQVPQPPGPVGASPGAAP